MTNVAFEASLDEVVAVRATPRTPRLSLVDPSTAGPHRQPTHHCQRQRHPLWHQPYALLQAAAFSSPTIPRRETLLEGWALCNTKRRRDKLRQACEDSTLTSECESEAGLVDTE